GRGDGRPTDVLKHLPNRRRLGAYLRRALEYGNARLAGGQLATCGVCQREADGLRRLRALLQQNIAVAEPDWTGFWPGVVRGVDTAKMARPASAARRAWRPKWALGGALAATLLVSVGVWQFG